MVAPITPAKKLSNGKDHIWLVTTLSSTTAPTAVQISAGLNVTGVLLADWDGLSATTDKVTIPRVLLETTATEVNGETRIGAADMQLVFQPQAVGGSAGKQAYELVKNGFVGYLVRRQDVQSTVSDAATAGQFFDVLGIDITSAIPGKTTSGPDGIYIATVPVSITSDDWNVAAV
jgi:hypothetical protein